MRLTLKVYLRKSYDGIPYLRMGGPPKRILGCLVAR